MQSVRAAGVNRLDLLQVRGQYPPPPGDSDVLGVEVSGVVTAAAADVPQSLVGTRVMALVGGAGSAIRTRWTTGAWPRNEGFIARQKAKGLLGRFGAKAPADADRNPD